MDFWKLIVLGLCHATEGLHIYYGDHSITQIHGSLHRNPKGLCRSPSHIHTALDHSPEKMVGRWFIYRRLLPGRPIQINPFCDLSLRSKNFETPKAVPGQIVAIDQYFCTQMNGPVNCTCQHQHHTGTYGLDGKITISQTGVSEKYFTTEFQILYHDHKRLVVLFSCAIPIDTRTGLCESPMFDVQIRSRPDLSSDYELDFIDNVVDSVLAPYDLSARDIPKQRFAKSGCT